MASDRAWENKNKRIVVIDSSALLMLFEFSIDLEDELTRLVGCYKIVVPKPIINELTFLSENAAGKKKRIAKPALKLAEGYETIDDSSECGDDSVISLAKKLGGIVFSNDKELRNRAKKEHLKIICLRGKNHLMLNEPVF